jgi:hypothetical protein
MLNDTINVYFKHQHPPGRSFFERGQYELVQGPDRQTITPAQWNSAGTPGGTVEMSVHVEMQPFRYGRCPRCRTHCSVDGWTTWQEFISHVWKLTYRRTSQHSQKPFNVRITTRSRAANRAKSDIYLMMKVDKAKISEKSTFRDVA